MNITIFGGSFNPPTLGHQVVLEQILKLHLIPGLDEIWLLPEYQHSFAKNQTLIEPKHRLAMLHLLTRSRVQMKQDLIDQKMSGNTIEHISYLKKTYPQHRFSFLLGSDNLKTFDLWPRWQKLLQLMTFYVYPRKSFPFKPLYPNMVPLTHPKQKVSAISSTMVREKIERGEDWEKLVPPAVADYIRKKRLFLTA